MTTREADREIGVRTGLGAALAVGLLLLAGLAGDPAVAGEETASSWQVSNTSQITVLGAVRKLSAQTIPTGPGTPPKSWKTLNNLILPRAPLAFGQYVDLLQNGTAQGVVTWATGQVTLDLPLRLRDSKGSSQSFTAYLTTGQTNGTNSDGGAICSGGSAQPSYCRGTALSPSGAFRMVAIVNVPQGGETLGSGAVLTFEISGSLSQPCAGTVCTASDACHVAGTCDPATGLCSNPVAPDGTACSDGNACTRADSCRGGACVGENLVVCAASDACHAIGTCDPATGVCSNPAAPNGTPCNDGSACTSTDSCQSGACVGGSPVACAPSDACHVAGTCDPATGACSTPAAPNGMACSDGNACTRADTCQNGTCVGGSPVACIASGTCRAPGTCNPATGACTDPWAPDGTACSDGNVCTSSDTCTSGACAGAPVPPAAEVDSSVRVARAGDAVRITWSPVGGATSFDLVRGLLATLPVGSAEGEACSGGLTAASATDAANPPVGEGYWYLVRGASPCGAGPYGFETVRGVPAAARATSACPEPCADAADCPGADTDCSSRACVSGTCGWSHKPSGSTTTAQTPGDCRRNVCDGSGAVTAVVDDTDVPVDGNACTLDACTSGAPSNPPSPARTPCSQGGGAVCDGTGGCVQCVVAADCPGADTDCRTRTCGASAPGACGYAYTPAGTPTPSQVPGDCRRSVCDGGGGPGSVVDDTDLPVDGSACTRDVCTAGTPSNPPVAAGTACSYSGSSGVCDGNGSCSPCGSLMQRCCSSYPYCRPGLSCKSGFCR